MIIRQAQGSDIPWLLAECKAFDQFFGAKHSLFPDEETAIEKISELMNPEVGCFYVAETDLARVGFIVGILSPHYFNPRLRTLAELLWWVNPLYRGTRAGLALLEAYIRFGAQHADQVVMTLEENSPINPSSLTKRGFRLKESNYLLEVA